MRTETDLCQCDNEDLSKWFQHKEDQNKKMYRRPVIVPRNYQADKDEEYSMSEAFMNSEENSKKVRFPEQLDFPFY